MRMFKLAGKYYCVASVDFVYEDFAKRISDGLCLRKNSFAEFYSKRIFQNFFQNANNLKKEYAMYYQEEYGDFADFLYKKELLSREDIEVLDLDEGQTLLKLNIDLFNYNADPLVQYEDNGVDILNHVLEEIEL